MFSHGQGFLHTLLFLLALSFAASSISDDIAMGSNGRSLLQTKKSCPIDFEFKNYTIITSRCKGPSYPSDKCCAAFKDFACPYAKQLNDPTNDCAVVMFSYINLYGHYPPGLFAALCTKSGSKGVPCPRKSAKTHHHQ